MLLVSSAAAAMQRSRQVHVNGRDYTLAEYVGAAPKHGIYVHGNEINDNGLPQGFLVIQPPGAVTPAHFHDHNQFQVFVEGNGRIGAHPATPVDGPVCQRPHALRPDRGVRIRRQVFHPAPALGRRCQVPAGVSRQAPRGQPARAGQGWPRRRQR